MHIWTQNLNEPSGSILFHGRGYITRRPYQGVKVGGEWLFFHKVRWSFGLSFETGHSDGDDGFLFHLSLPWLFSLYLSLDGVCRVKEARRFEMSIHDCGVWFIPWGRTMDWRSVDPWWIKGLHWSFPWERTWVYTRVLSLDGKSILFEDNSLTKRRFLDTYDQRKQIEASVSETHPYRYVLKNGKVQERTATIHVEEMAWGFKWWRRPFFVRRSIDVAFSDEVGEKTGSWKGGCVGCGYEMREGETPLATLRRMERERTF